MPAKTNSKFTTWYAAKITKEIHIIQHEIQPQHTGHGDNTVQPIGRQYSDIPSETLHGSHLCYGVASGKIMFHSQTWLFTVNGRERQSDEDLGDVER